MNNTVLVSLAILKTNWERHRKDYLENFIPMLAESIRNLPGAFSVSQLQAAFEQDFGLRVPQNVLYSLVRRLRRRDLVSVLDQDLFRGNTTKLDASTFKETQRGVLEAHNIVIEDMLRYLDSVYGVKWTPDEAEGHLEAYLQDNRLVIQGLSPSSTLLVASAPPTKQTRFLVCSYIDHLHATDKEKYAYFDTVLKGNFLANAVFLPEPAEALRKFRNTSVFFDTPFLMSALGWAGRTRREPCLELLSLLYETGAELSCFRHTLSEIDRILDACAHRLSLGSAASLSAGNKTDEYFISVGYSAADIDLLRAQLERRLQSLRIVVVDVPEFSTQNMPLDEEEFSDYLQSSINYGNRLALQHDVDCLSAVLRIRGGREYLRVEDCRGIFVTTNHTLAGASMRYFYRTASSRSISPIITDTTLTNLLWLKKPFAAPDLPRKRLIADCFAACQPSDELWCQYVDQIRHLRDIGDITSDDYYILRHSYEAKAEMMRLTQGDDEAFSVEKVSEVLASIKEKNERELREELKVSEIRRIDAESKLAAASDFEMAVHESIDRKALVIGRIAYWLFSGTLVTTLAIASLVGVFQTISDFGAMSLVLTTAAVVGEICSVVSLAKGTIVDRWARLIEVRTHRIARTWLLAQFAGGHQR